MKPEELEEILDLLREKKELFVIYEDMTIKLLSCEFEETDDLIYERSCVAKKIDAVDNKIQKLSNSDESGVVKTALKNTCTRGELPGCLQIIFDVSQKIFSIVNRIKNMNDEIAERILIEQKEILSEIRQINTGQEAKAAKFYGTTYEVNKPYFSGHLKSI
jgi:hypothetical protein